MVKFHFSLPELRKQPVFVENVSGKCQISNSRMGPRPPSFRRPCPCHGAPSSAVAGLMRVLIAFVTSQRRLAAQGGSNQRSIGADDFHLIISPALLDAPMYRWLCTGGF